MQGIAYLQTLTNAQKRHLVTKTPFAKIRLAAIFAIANAVISRTIPEKNVVRYSMHIVNRVLTIRNVILLRQWILSW